MNKDTGFSSEIERLQQQFYSTQSKAVLFKSNQKMQCAASVANGINLDEWIQKTVFIIPQTNKIFMDYTVFKAYGHPEIYTRVVDYILVLLSSLIDQYDSYETHINIDTFTPSACQRHKSCVELFLSKCMNHETEFSKKCLSLHLYNAPSVFETVRQILNPLIHPSLKQKIKTFSKSESDEPLQTLFTSTNS